MRIRSILFLSLLSLLAAASAAVAQDAATSCEACHGDQDLFEGDQLAIVESFQADVHAEAGLSCHDCHGGNPSPELADDMFSAKDESLADNPFRGKPSRAQTPDFCGRCHSDPGYMRRFRPDAVTDQEKQYWTSQHGVALTQGDEKVAVCTDCHGVHGIRRIGDPDATVYPTNVASTCGACHGDPEHMAGYETPDGRPLPVGQDAAWRLSVHANAMFAKGDLSAPTCNDCHGSHGARPPGLDAVALVCGQCHGREAELFRKSPKHRGFQSHTELLADAGSEGCAACHEPPDPAANWTASHVLVECTTCHDQHAILRPSVALLAPLPETPCAFCHEAPAGDADELLATDITRANYKATKDGLIIEASEQGLEGDRRFNWLVDRALALPFHTAGMGEEVELRPEFERLFDKFRIGKTAYELIDSESGQTVSVEVRRCTNCHAAEPGLADEPIGLNVAQEILTKSQSLSVRTASAERVLLRARRGGVETREAATELDQAVDASIQLEALVHTFSLEPDGPFLEEYQRGVEHADAALDAGREALGELVFRRRGLIVALVVILVLLVALGLKIRQLDESST